jgi:hypothetical protein
MQFLLAHAPYIHTCRTKHSHANPKIDFRWPWALVLLAAWPVQESVFCGWNHSGI